MKGRSNLNIGRKEVHGTGDPRVRPHLDIERWKVKVTRPLNAVTNNQPYLQNGKAYNFKLGIRMEYDDPHHRHVRRPQFDACLPKTQQWNVAVTPNWHEGCPCHGWHSASLPRSKVKVTRPLWVAVQDTTCRGRGIWWRPHYRLHSLLLYVKEIW